MASSKVIGASIAGAGGYIIALNPHDVGFCAAAFALFAIGIMVINNRRLAIMRQGTAIALAAMAGTSIPALLADPQQYWLIGLVAYLFVALAYRICKPLGKAQHG